MFLRCVSELVIESREVRPCALRPPVTVSVHVLVLMWCCRSPQDAASAGHGLEDCEFSLVSDTENN